jgi:RNA polymerase sigma-70 factor (ECF subfamily)
MTDEELMENYKKGSVSAFEELYKRYHQKVMGFLGKKLAHEEVKEEVFQQVFTRLHQKKHLYDTSYPFAPWFFTLIRNVIIDHYRKEKVDYVELATEVESEEQNSEAPDKEGVLSDLDEKDAVLLYKKFVEGLSYKELEAELSAKSSALRKRVSRLIKKLKG